MDYNKLFNESVQFKKASVSNATSNFDKVKYFFKQDMNKLKNVIADLESKYSDNLECINYGDDGVGISFKDSEVLSISVEQPDLMNRTDDDRDFKIVIENKHKDEKEKVIFKLEETTKYYYLNTKELKKPTDAFYVNESNNSEMFIEYILNKLANIVAEEELNNYYGSEY